MKKIMMMIIVLILGVSCKNNTENSLNLKLNSDKKIINPDNKDEVIFTVKIYNEAGEEINPEEEIIMYYYKGSFEEKSFKSNIPGKYKFYAIYKEIKSNVLEIEVKEEFENMILVEGGKFLMGDTFEVKIENAIPVHEEVLNDYFISKYEVSQNEWEEVMKYNNVFENYRKNEFPIFNISWYEAIEFCNKKSEKEGLEVVYSINKENKDLDNLNEEDVLKWKIKADFNRNGYRLPTEAEWEYAARGGKYSKGFRYSGSDDFKDVFVGNYPVEEHPKEVTYN